jgi:hypothetical protein
MKTIGIFLSAAILVLASGVARAAEEWGIEHEEKARFEAKVVDVLCELSGDCPARCGGGKRQLGLLRDDGRLILAVKNQDLFAGASNDLLPFCGTRLIVDGLMIKDPLMPLFQIQFRRPAPDGKWRRANQFRRDWAKERDLEWESDMAGAWYNHDKRVKQVIAKDGVFGIPGLEPEE